jgi:hypothetical protein
MGGFGFGGAGGPLVKQAATPVAGFALQNATPTILSWTAPNNGQVHRFWLIAVQHVTSLETGGEVDLAFTLPDGTTVSGVVMFAAGSSAGASSANIPRLIESGTAVTITQATALTAGAAVVWAEIWGS